MNHLAKIIVLLIFTLVAPLAFSAGDYIWEEKFKKALPKAEQGDEKSQYAVAEMYEKGKGAEKDLRKAFSWYVKAANTGDKKAAYKVGLFYYQGRGIPKNYKIARTWLTKSAKKNYARAQYYLGEIYEHGRGVLKDSDTAIKWYKLALKGGFGIAADGIKRVASARSKPAVTKKRRPTKKPKKIVKAKPVTPTIEKVLKGGWKKRKKAVEYLPSAVTKCTRKDKNLECVSKDLKRNIGMADITYTTKAILFGFKESGKFKVSYRNKVSKIKVTSEEFAESGESVPVKLGWQDAEHKLVCKLESDKKMACVKNKTRKIKLTR